MPTISMYYGILIRMYFAPKEHNPSHFHAFYQNDTAIFLIESGELSEDSFPKKQSRLVQA